MTAFDLILPRPRRRLREFQGDPVGIEEVGVEAAGTRAGGDAHGRRLELDAVVAQLLVSGLDVISHEAKVGAAKVAGPQAFWISAA